MDPLPTARRRVDRARAGDLDVAGLVESQDAIGRLPWSREAYEVGRLVEAALVGSADRGAVCRILERLLGPLTTVQALLLADDDPLTEPFPENPWGILPTDRRSDALSRLWDAVEDRAPRLVAELHGRVAGLVLCRGRRGPGLGYLFFHELDSADPDDPDLPPFDRRAALAWERFGDLQGFVGAAPAGGPFPRPIPAPLAALYAIHGGLRGRMWQLSGPADLRTWDTVVPPRPDGRLRTEDPNDAALAPDQLLCVLGYGDDRSDLLDLRDPRSVVRGWGDGRLYAGGGRPFWAWVDALHPLWLGAT